MKNFWRKITGQEYRDNKKRALEEILELERQVQEKNNELEKISQAEEYAKLGAKELATHKKEPYIAVLSTQINEQNPRNGFFELDWNEYFVVQLKAAGYYGENEEEIVDQWFTQLCRQIGEDAGVSMYRRGSGHINVSALGGGKSEVS